VIEFSLLTVAGIMFIATIFRTVFGFGEALVAVPLLATVISIKIAAPVAVLASIVIAGFVVIRDWKHIHIRGAAWLIFAFSAYSLFSAKKELFGK
jgi:hypothetical protein